MPDLREWARETVATLTSGDWERCNRFVEQHSAVARQWIILDSDVRIRDRHVFALVAYLLEVAEGLTANPVRTYGELVELGVKCRLCIGYGKVQEHPYCGDHETCIDCGGDGNTDFGRAVTREREREVREGLVSTELKLADETIAEAKALTYVVTKSELPDMWTAHCLELDVVSQSPVGGGPMGALESTIEAAALQIHWVRQEGNDPFERRAPDECWPPELLPDPGGE